MKEQIYNGIVESGLWLLNKFFPEYYAKEPLSPTDRYIEYPWVLHNISITHSMLYHRKILDVGCAGSMFPLLIKALSHNEVYGIDIRNCEYPEIEFRKEDISKNTFEDDYFDVVTAVSTIEHIGLKGRYGNKVTNIDDVKAINEIHRILKPHGIFLMTVPFGKKYEEGKFHRIYNKECLDNMLEDFKHTIRIVKSPEADYEIALIRGIK